MSDHGFNEKMGATTQKPSLHVEYSTFRLDRGVHYPNLNTPGVTNQTACVKKYITSI